MEKLRPTPLKSIIYLLTYVSFLCPVIITAQENDSDCKAKSLQEFYDCYGGINAFSGHSIDALTTFIDAEDAINEGNYSKAKMMVDQLFGSYPAGDANWWNVFSGVNGSNIGSPHAYYGLRMLQDILDYNLVRDENVTPIVAKMKVILPGCSEGVQPRNNSELQSGSGTRITNRINPALLENDYRIVRQSLDFFLKYVTAITNGKLVIELDVIELPNYCIPASVSGGPPYFAISDASLVWDEISEEVKQSTDWWWLLYPSHVPKGPDFADKAFITGGMGIDEKGGPMFIADDLFIVNKPAHLGTGTYSDIERRVYAPQWFQHEFFHHLYRAYPELKLEINGHDWFDRNFWPDDFEGIHEPDFYAESLHKRLQLQCSSLQLKLSTSIDAQRALLDKLTIEDVLGTYSLDVIQNEWHEGDIIESGSKYYWRNKAGVQWEVFPDLKNGRLDTGPDSPYKGKDFFIELYRNNNGESFPAVSALKFQGEFYRRRSDLASGNTPIEITLGAYERVPAKKATHRGEIVKDEGQFTWENENTEIWSLVPNRAQSEYTLNDSSPFPEEKFDFILIEQECSNTHVLGFEFMEAFYVGPKNDPNNQSPIVNNTLDDLNLEERFSSFEIDISAVFSDSEGDKLFYYAFAEESDLVETQIEGQLLTLNESGIGSATIIVAAVDENGGHVSTEFELNVEGSTSIFNEELPELSIHPNPTVDKIILNTPNNLKYQNISVFDMLGNKLPITVKSKSEDSIELSLNIEASGTLIIMLETDKGKIYQNLVIKL